MLIRKEKLLFDGINLEIKFVNPLEMIFLKMHLEGVLKKGCGKQKSELCRKIIREIERKLTGGQNEKA